MKNYIIRNGILTKNTEKAEEYRNAVSETAEVFLHRADMLSRWKNENREESSERTDRTELTADPEVPQTAETYRYGRNDEASVCISSDAVRIGSGTFPGRTDLKEVIIDEHVTEIKDGAFSQCTQLKTVLFPAELKRIGAGAFSGCTSLEHVYFMRPAEIGDHAFSGCTSLEFLFIPYASHIDRNAFADCSQLKLVIAGAEGEELKRVFCCAHPDLRLISFSELLRSENRDVWNRLIPFIEKREALYRQIYGHSEEVYSSADCFDEKEFKDKEVTVIGCGGAGREIINDISDPQKRYRRRANHACYFTGIDTCMDHPDLLIQQHCITLYESGRVSACGGLGSAGDAGNVLTDAVTYMNKYLHIIKNSRQIILVSGLSRRTGPVLLCVIAMVARYCNVPLKALLLRPSGKENSLHKWLAAESLETIRRIIPDDQILTAGLFEDDEEIAEPDELRELVMKAAADLLEKNLPDIQTGMKTGHPFLLRYTDRTVLEILCRRYDPEWLDSMDETVFSRIFRLFIDRGCTFTEKYMTEYLCIFQMNEVTVARAFRYFALIYGRDYLEMMERYPSVFMMYCLKLDWNTHTYEEGKPFYTKGIIRKMYSPKQYIHGKPVDRKCRNLIMLEIDDGTLRNKHILMRQDRCDTDLSVNDRIEILEIYSRGNLFIAVRKDW